MSAVNPVLLFCSVPSLFFSNPTIHLSLNSDGHGLLEWRVGVGEDAGAVVLLPLLPPLVPLLLRLLLLQLLPRRAPRRPPRRSLRLGSWTLFTRRCRSYRLL